MKRKTPQGLRNWNWSRHAKAAVLHLSVRPKQEHSRCVILNSETGSYKRMPSTKKDFRGYKSWHLVFSSHKRSCVYISVLNIHWAYDDALMSHFDYVLKPQQLLLSFPVEKQQLVYICRFKMALKRWSGFMGSLQKLVNMSESVSSKGFDMACQGSVFGSAKLSSPSALIKRSTRIAQRVLCSTDRDSQWLLSCWHGV